MHHIQLIGGERLETDESSLCTSTLCERGGERLETVWSEGGRLWGEAGVPAFTAFSAAAAAAAAAATLSLSAFSAASFSAAAFAAFSSSSRFAASTRAAAARSSCFLRRCSSRALICSAVAGTFAQGFVHSFASHRIVEWVSRFHSSDSVFVSHHLFLTVKIATHVRVYLSHAPHGLVHWSIQRFIHWSIGPFSGPFIYTPKADRGE